MMKSKFMSLALFLAIFLLAAPSAYADRDDDQDNAQMGLKHRVDALENDLADIQLTPGPPGADGNDGLNGVLTGKGDSHEEQLTADGEIYTTTSEPVQSTSIQVIAIAFCVDANDIAIAGQCFGNLNWSLSRAGIGSNADSINFARQICIWNKPSSDSSSAGAQVSCIKVPGP